MSNAQEHLEKAIQIHPEYADAHYELALLLSNNSEYEKSKEHFLKTIEIRPEFSLAHFNYALLLNKMKDHKASQEHFLKAIDIDQHFADAHYHFGLLLADLEDFEEAKNNLEKATDIDQNHTLAYYHLGKLLIDPEDYEKAKKNYLTAIDIDGTFKEAHYYLGKLLSGGVQNDKDGTLVARPEYEDAIVHYKKAISIDKNYAKAHPHTMGEWSSDSKTHVATMSHGDFKSNEKSLTLSNADEVRIELVGADGSTTVLKDKLALLKGEVIDATVMSKRALVEFLTKEIADAREKGILLSLHFKATMMKVSDPIIFGHALEVYFSELFKNYSDTFEKLGINPNDGLETLFDKIGKLPEDQHKEIEAAIKASIENGPDLAMVNSDKGITNLHVPSDVIIDASMPAMIRTSGCMWNPAGELQETKVVDELFQWRRTSLGSSHQSYLKQFWNVVDVLLIPFGHKLERFLNTLRGLFQSLS